MGSVNRLNYVIGIKFFGAMNGAIFVGCLNDGFIHLGSGLEDVLGIFVLGGFMQFGSVELHSGIVVAGRVALVYKVVDAVGFLAGVHGASSLSEWFLYTANPTLEKATPRVSWVMTFC